MNLLFGTHTQYFPGANGFDPLGDLFAEELADGEITVSLGSYEAPFGTINPFELTEASFLGITLHGTIVPEPSTFALFAGGLILLGVSRRGR